MSTHDRREGGNLSIIEAVETLSHIADLEIDRGMAITQQHDLVFQTLPISYKTVHWLHPENADMTITLVKDIFKVVLNYLHNFYKTQYRYIKNENAVEEIKSIMVLVGEAAKKLDKYTSLFNKQMKESVTDTKEYRELEEFYLKHIARKIDSGVLGKWILGIAKRHILKEEKPVARKVVQKTKHVFVDLESVRKDTEYELFYLKKEDGSRFFSPRLIRNVKLLCDFGDYFGEGGENDLLADIRFHYDLLLHSAARNILRSFGSRMDDFYRECSGYQSSELILSLNKAFMALLLCSHDGHLLRNSPIKSCVGYFKDFQFYLREALHTRDYQKLVAYPPNPQDKLPNLLLETTQSLCRALFANIKALQGFITTLKNILLEARELDAKNHVKSRFLWNRLAEDYAALTKLFKTHKHGPLVQVLENIEERDSPQEFDPIRQGNIPNQLFTLYFQNFRCVNIRFPTPTYQEFINKAVINEEFKAFLRSYMHVDKENGMQKGHLLFNFQDKTSWKEHARSSALEELQKHPDFSPVLTVVTLPKDTEFYHQLAPYHRDNHATTFIKHFKEHLKDPSTGFYFPPAIHKEIFSGFTDQLMEAIHRLFFANKNVLTRENRLDFIEIFEFFLQLKIIEIVKPHTFSFTCKDGLDVGAAESAKLYVFLKLLSQPELSESEIDYLNLLLYSPVVIYRERHMLFDRFNRLNSALRSLEVLKDELGFDNFSQIIHQTLSPLYQTPILDALTLLPQTTETPS